MRATTQQIEEAKRLISEYLYDEFANEDDHEDDFDNLKNIGIAYCTNEPTNWLTGEVGETFDIQVDVDLITMTVKKKIDWDATLVTKFDSFDEFRSYLENLDFCDLISMTDSEWNTVFTQYPSWKPLWWDEYYANL